MSRAAARRVPGALVYAALRSAGLAVALALAQAAPAAGQGEVQAAWVQLGTSGPSLRAITRAARCPRAAAIDVDGLQRPVWQDVMTRRAAPQPPAFPDRVCEWLPPSDVRTVAVEGWPRALRLPHPDPRRVVAIGDSGCLGADQGQDCDQEWYFPALARFAAARQPDLVIHLGDYNYRGTSCIAYDACCTYNPDSCGFPDCGDTAQTWHDDFFDPAAPLLAAAPWVMTRGNHELCSRAGAGYFRYLAPQPAPPQCAANPVDEPTYTDPYSLALGDDLRLLVLDSANACGEPGLRDQVTPYRRQFALLADRAAADTAAQTWLVTHKPVWSVLRALAGPPVLLDYTLQQAAGNRLPPAVSLVLSGHQHLFQSLTMTTPGAPAVLVAGNGGAMLDDPAWVAPLLQDIPTGGPTIGAAVTVHDHGYLVIEPRGSTWTAALYDRYDQPLATCDAAARPAICRTP